ITHPHLTYSSPYPISSPVPLPFVLSLHDSGTPLTYTLSLHDALPILINAGDDDLVAWLKVQAPCHQVDSLSGVLSERDFRGAARPDKPGDLPPRVVHLCF